MNKLFLRDLLTGLVAIFALASLIGMLIFFGEVAPLTQRRYEFTLRVANAAGLDDTSPVMLNGVKVGQIRASRVTSGLATVTNGAPGATQGALQGMGVQPIPAHAGTAPGAGAELIVAVDKGVLIPRAAKISVDRAFVGGSTLEFTTTDLSPVQLSDAIREGETLDGGAPETLLDNIRNLVEGPLQKLSQSADTIDALAVEWTKVGREVREMLEPRTQADVDAGKAPNLRTTLARLDAAVDGANAWLNDQGLRDRVRESVDNANKILTDAQGLIQTWKDTGAAVDATAKQVTEQAAKLDQRAGELTQAAKATLARLQSAADGLTATLDQVNQGQGTLGQLVTNPDLYRNLDDAARRLDATLEEARQLIEKFKAEGVRLKF